MITTFDPGNQATRKLVINLSGALVDLEGLIKQSEAVYRAQYGALDRDLYNKAAASPNSELKAVVGYAVALPIKQKHPNASKFRTAVKAAVAKAAKLVVHAWTQAGAKIVWQSSSAPLLHIKAKGSVLTSEKNTPSVLFVKEFVPFTPKHGAAQSTTDLNLGSVFYNNNQYGDGIAVGISNEQADGDCPLTPHSYYGFGQTPGGQVNYSTEDQTDCETDAVCDVCDTNAGDGVCRDNVCVTRHGALVAGMVGHSVGILYPRGAPLVDLYFNNNSSWSHGQQLDWFYDNDVHVENESWTGAPDTYKQDYYPIVGMGITEIAGNGSVKKGDLYQRGGPHRQLHGPGCPGGSSGRGTHSSATPDPRAGSGHGRRQGPIPPGRRGGAGQDH